MKDASFGIYIPSYKRAKTCITHKWLDNYRYVVRKSEETDYIAAGIPPENILAVHDNQINGMVKVNQWLIDNAEEEIICILDDDIRRMVYRLDKAVDIPGPETATAELERIAQVMVDLRIGFGAVDATVTPWNYDMEFAFRGAPGRSGGSTARSSRQNALRLLSTTTTSMLFFRSCSGIGLS